MSIGQVIEMIVRLFPVIVEFITSLFGNKEGENADANA